MLFKANIANFISWGDQISHLPDGSWSRNIINFNLKQHCCCLTISPQILQQYLRESASLIGRCVSSAQISISCVERVGQGEEILTDICNLLSLATTSQVVWTSYDFGETGRGISVIAGYNRGHPLIPYQEHLSVRRFMESCWDNYQDLKTARKLSAVIEYLNQCNRRDQPLEIKIILISVALEALKFTYLKSKNEKKKSFQSALIAMLSDVGMTVDFEEIKEVVSLRNDVVHQGLSEKDYKHMKRVYNSAQDIAREYLLRLLGYQGDYLIYSKACRERNTLDNA